MQSEKQRANNQAEASEEAREHDRNRQTAWKCSKRQKNWMQNSRWVPIVLIKIEMMEIARTHKKRIYTQIMCGVLGNCDVVLWQPHGNAFLQRQLKQQ